MGEQALSVLREIISHGLQPNVISYNAAILSCSSAGRVCKVLDLFDEMVTRDLDPDVQICGRLLMECEQGHLYDRERYMLHRLSEMIDVPPLIGHLALIGRGSIVANALTLRSLEIGQVPLMVRCASSRQRPKGAPERLWSAYAYGPSSGYGRNISCTGSVPLFRRREMSTTSQMS